MEKKPELKTKEFPNYWDLVKWANSPKGTEHIISIIERDTKYGENNWIIFYID